MTTSPGRLVITGTGRSGTGYVSTLLTAVGVPCGHEAVFGPPQAFGIASPIWRHYAADASWLAVPAIARGLHPGPVWIQLRHPLIVIDSLDRLNLLAPEREATPNAYRGAIASLAADVFAHPDPLSRVAHFVTVWPFMAGDFPTYAVEHLNPSLVAELAEATGAVSMNDPSAALARIPNTVNTERAAGRRRPPSAVAFDLKRLTPGTIVAELVDRYAPHYPDVAELLG